MSYENYIKRMERKQIDSVDWKCPKCGASLDFMDCPDETYMNDGTFVREELLECVECDVQIKAEQVYVPGKLKVEVREGGWW